MKANAKKKWFDDPYGNKQLHLRKFATYLDHQRRGAGTQHCRWGLQLAKEQIVPITVFGSPMGKRLYSQLGFSFLATSTCQVEGEDEMVFDDAMVHRGMGL